MHFWFLAAQKVLGTVLPSIKRERYALREEADFTEAFASTPLLEWDRIKGFTRGGAKVSAEEILSDPHYAHFVQCRDFRRPTQQYH